MIEVNAKEARRRFSELLDRCTLGEEIIILRRGRVVSRWLPAERVKRSLPDLESFRASLGQPGTPFARLQRDEREGR